MISLLSKRSGDEGAAHAGRPLDPVAEPPAPPADTWGFAQGDEVVPGRHVLSRLGGGSRYEAYLAWDERLHTTVVAKVIRPGRVEEGATLQGLADEAAALAAMNHPVIVRGFDLVTDGPRPHLLLEHLEGPRLSSLIRRHGALGPEQLASLGIQLSAALHYFHAEGWVHLDVKPANVIMGAPPRLIDLSIALPQAAARDLREPIGTDSYMPPEQCRPSALRPVGPPADVFALGVTLYRAATGSRPFGEGAGSAADRESRWPQLVEEPLPLDGQIPGAAGEAVEAALAYEPGDRPTPAELCAAFEELLGGLPKPRLGRLKPRLV